MNILSLNTFPTFYTISFIFHSILNASFFELEPIPIIIPSPITRYHACFQKKSISKQPNRNTQSTCQLRGRKQEKHSQKKSKKRMNQSFVYDRLA
jgi:hypothetical protein